MDRNLSEAEEPDPDLPQDTSQWDADDQRHYTLTGENPFQRSNRQLAELLQEMRVVQVGGQIVFAFLLAMPFQPAFAELGVPERVLYTAAVVLTAVAMFLLMTPVALHRAWFESGLKSRIIRHATRMTGWGLALMGPGILFAILLVLSLATNWTWAFVVTGPLALVVVALWGLLPLTARRRSADSSDDR